MMKLVVLSCLLAASSASLLAGHATPLAWSAPLLSPYNYRGPLSLAPGQPANIIAADGRPLDTLDVNLDRSAHYTAKALEGSGVHLLRKRSAIFAPSIGGIAYGSSLVSAPLAYSTQLLTPSNYRGPLSLAPGQPANIIAADGRPLDTLDVNLDRSAHYTAKALEGSGVHLLRKRSAIFAPSIGGIAYGSSLVSAPLAYSTQLLTPSNYRGPLSLAPGQPANIIAADGRPLDTLDVNLDRSAHYTAKALEGSGVHLLRKRSAIFAPSIGGIAYGSSLVSAPLAYSTQLLTPSNYRGPLSLAPGQPANIIAADGRPLDTLDVNLDRSAHYIAKALDNSGIHLLKKRSAVFATPVSRVAYGAPWIGAPLGYSSPVVSAAHITPYSAVSYGAPFAHTLYK